MDEIDVWSGTRIARLSCLEISNGLRHPEDLFTQKFETRFVIFLTPKTKRETWLIILEREKLVESIGLSSAIGDTVLSTRDPLSSFIRSNLHPIQIVLFCFFVLFLFWWTPLEHPNRSWRVRSIGDVVQRERSFSHNTQTFLGNGLLLLGYIRYGNEFKSSPSLVFVSGLNTISDFSSLFNYCTHTALVPLRIRKTNRHLSSSPSFRRCIINRRPYTQMKETKIMFQWKCL